MRTLVQNLLSFLLIGAFFTLVTPTNLQAGDCSTAINNINGIGGAGLMPTSFTPGCALAGVFGIPFCSGDIWVEWTPNRPGESVNNISFDVAVRNASTMSGSVTAGTQLSAAVFLIYANCKDAGSTCGWNGGTNKGDDAYRIVFQETAAYQNIPNGTNVNRRWTFDNLDGSGTYYWVIMRSAGSDGGASVGRTTIFTAAPFQVSTCTNPVNDDCVNATTLTLGNGIDPLVTTSTTNSIPWSAGIQGTTTCATIERPQNYWPSNVNVGPDMRWDPISPFFRAPGYSATFNGASPCNTEIDNSVWYRMQVPTGASSSDWYLHIGNVNCSPGGSGIKVTTFRNFDCSNGSVGRHLFRGNLNNRAVCGTARFSGNYPGAPDLTLGDVNNSTSSFDLTGSTNGWYYILIDGENGSQCDFTLVMSRSDNNFILPVEMSRLEGHNEGHHNILSWETATETNSWLFEVERSLDGDTFSAIGQVDAAGDSQSPIEYSFIDREAPLGLGLYRLKTVDLDGESVYSQVIEITRSSANFELHEVYPVPFGNEVNIVFSSAREITSHVEMLDVAGKVVLKETLTPTLGSNQVTLGTSNLPSGMYFIRFSQDGETIVRKVVK